MKNVAKPEVAIVFRYIPHFRVDFYEGLRAELDRRGIKLRLLAGDREPEESTRRDAAWVDWAERVDNRYFSIGGRTVVWQGCLRSLRTADLVIVEQATKLPLNGLLMAWRKLGGPRLAFWGHGTNLQGDGSVVNRASEWIKRGASRWCDHWFAYTDSTRDIVISDVGYPPEQITVVQNAIDTKTLQRHLEGVTSASVATTLEELDLTGTNLAIFVGSLYPLKRVPFLLEAAARIREHVPDFELIIVGDGPDFASIAADTTDSSYVRLVGAHTGADMVQYAAPAKVWLNPGLVGLSILDAFALGLPFVTCDLPYHSPEVDYLDSMVNGVLVDDSDSAEAFADAVIPILTEDDVRSSLSEGARSTASQITVEGMVQRFADGVVRALA